jgi:integrase
MYHFGMSERNELNLSRRHIKACDKTGKTPEPRNKKEEKADTCECPIVADGYLALEPKRILHLSLSTNDWKQANTRKGELLTRRRISTPNRGLPSGQVTVAHAVEKYLASRGPSSTTPLSEATLGKYEVLLKTRLLPFCTEEGIDWISDFDDFDLTERFVLSWVNLNPHHNRKGDPVSLPLASGTKRVSMEAFRAFMKYCCQQKWNTENQPKDMKVVYERPQPKYGLEHDEYARLLATAKEWSVRRAARRDPREMVAMIELLRWTGIRVSDCIAFDESQLLPNVGGNGWRVVIERMKKTGGYAGVPIPTHVAELIKSLPFKGDYQGKRYWFWTGVGGQDTAVTNLEEDITAIMKLAQAKIPFRHHASPHTLRHTFACQHLNTGVDIRQISVWLGHKSVSTTEDHYVHAVHSTNLRSEAIAAESWKKQLLA